MTRALFVLGVVAWSGWASAEEVERIWLDGEVNGKPVHFVFDTGSIYSALLRQTVEKLGLHLTPPQSVYSLYTPAGNQDLQFTEECAAKVREIEGPTRFAVLDMPAGAITDFDGILGWSSVTNAVVSIDAFVGGVTFLAKVPSLAAEWQHIPAISVYSGLGLEIEHGNHRNGVVVVDTGSDEGVALPPQTWRKWKKAHPRSPLTLGFNYTPSGGRYVYEEAWAEEISFGPLTFKNVPIEEGNPFASKPVGKGYEGTIGLAALKRLELVVDPRQSVAYWRQRKSTQSRYSYNRLGAIFTGTSKRPDEHVARVIKDGPAYIAGVRDGDLLLDVDGIKVTSSTDNCQSRFYLPAGTRLRLSLARRGKLFQTTATLSEILPGQGDR
jgi:hypothetical protein